MSCIPILTAKYKMMHSQWADGNPAHGDTCSVIKINGSQGFWFSTNCSQGQSVVCMQYDQMLYYTPGITQTSVETSSSMISSFNDTCKYTKRQIFKMTECHKLRF